MPESTVELTAFVLLKAGDWRGGTELSLEPEAPSGHKHPKLSFHPNFEGMTIGGFHSRLIKVSFKEAGLYWFHVSLNQQLITRMPLRAVYEAYSGVKFDGNREQSRQVTENPVVTGFASRRSECNAGWSTTYQTGTRFSIQQGVPSRRHALRNISAKLSSIFQTRL